MMHATRLTAVFALFALVSCGAASPRELQAELGTGVTVAPGEVVKISELKVRFIAVTEDSRCPRDTTCFWAGEVKVQIAIEQPSQPLQQAEVEEGGNTVVGDYRVTVLRVQPERTSETKIPPQDYRATLKVDKAV
ncbi:MAG TPA: hypothetical protein VIT67_14495 [Povalibacter sp.]